MILFYTEMTTNTPDVVESDSDRELIKLEDVHFPGGLRCRNEC